MAEMHFIFWNAVRCLTFEIRHWHLLLHKFLYFFAKQLGRPTFVPCMSCNSSSHINSAFFNIKSLLNRCRCYFGRDDVNKNNRPVLYPEQHSLCFKPSFTKYTAGWKGQQYVFGNWETQRVCSFSLNSARGRFPALRGEKSLLGEARKG